MSSMPPSLANAPDYDEQRLVWRKSLTDTQVRDLAYEYRIGNYDDCSSDAWAEYLHRFGEDTRGPSKEFTRPNTKDVLKQTRNRRRKGAQGATSRSS